LDKREVLAVIGQSGAGKTTLLRMLSMSLKRSGGSIRLFEKEFSEIKDPYDVLRNSKISMVFQEDVLWQDLSV
jgi:putative ABC transport system ATP-binding protein